MKEVRRYMGVGSTVVGLVCYALSSSFNRLYGDWNSFKICAYMVSSSIICLAILFPKAWQNQSIFEYRAHMTFLVMASTTVYSFYLDRKMNTKPDAYGPISSAAFATTSLCMSKQVECGFVDLLYFFCGVLITQLMQITPFLGFVGTGFSYFMVILRSYLDDAPPNRSQSQPPPQVVIDMASLLQSSALDARPQEEEEEEGSNQNQAAIAPFYSSASLRSTSRRANSHQIEAEWIEQYEPGIYMTLVALRDGTRDLKRVRFSRRRFGEHQAETWWSENRDRVYERYNVRTADKSSNQVARRAEGAGSPVSQT